MSRRTATPFDALLGLQPPARLPSAASTTVVVSGRRVTDPCQLHHLLGDDDPLGTRLRSTMVCRCNAVQGQRDRRDRERKRASQRAWYQAHRETILAHQHAWYRANRETVLAKVRAKRAAKCQPNQPTPDERTDA